MSKLVRQLLNTNLHALVPYESARRLFSGGDSEKQIWLNANESPFANSYAVNAKKFNRYPDCQPAGVIGGYARYAGVSENQLLVSRGADEGIELLIRAFCTPSVDSILICPPTYGMYAISAETCDIGIEKAVLNTDFSLDLPTIFSYKNRVKLVFLCSPNNPTGTTIRREDIRAVLEHFADSALVVVDEAYVEFDSESSWVSELDRYPNLVVLRTLSKAFALAGLRCGFTLASTEIISALMKVIAPYPIPEPVAQIAAQALEPGGILRLREQVEFLQTEKQRLAEALLLMAQVEPVGDIKGNFLLFRTKRKQALMDYLISCGILLRDYSKQIHLENCLRITVGNAEQNDRLLAEMTNFFSQPDN